MNLIEPGKDVLQLVGRNALAGIGDRQRHLVPPGIVLYRHGDSSALRRMLERVRHEVVDHFLHLPLVEPHHHRRGCLHTKRYVFCRRIILEKKDSLIDEPCEVLLPDEEAGLTLLLLTEVEKLGEQAAELHAVTIDAKEHVAKVGREVALFQKVLGQADNDGQRRADLVRHIGEEAELRLVLRLDIAHVLLLILERLCHPDAVAVVAEKPDRS